MRALVRQTCALFELKLLQGVVSQEQVPSLVSAPPNRAPRASRRRITGRTASTRFAAFPMLKQRSWGRHVWGRGSVCATGGQMTAAMIQEYRAQPCEPDRADNFRTASSQRVLAPYPAFQSIRLTHQLQLVGVQLPVLRIFGNDKYQVMTGIPLEA